MPVVPTTLNGVITNYESEAVTLPGGTASTTARIMVQAVGNVFFDISDANFTLANLNNYEGYFSQADCQTISGWVADRNRLNTAINVSVYDGTTLLTTVAANQLRSDVGGYLGDNGLHGFSVATPAALKDGAAHNVVVRFEASTANLGNSPRSLTCSAALTQSIASSSAAVTPRIAK